MRSEAKKISNKKWDDANTEKFMLQMRKGTKEQWKAMAEKSGLSLAAFIREAVAEKAERDGLA